MTRGDKGKLFFRSVPLFTLSLFSKTVCSLWPVMHLLSQTTSRQLEHATFAGRQSELKKQTKQTKGKIMPFETTYHPGVKTIEQILMQNMESHPK